MVTPGTGPAVPRGADDRPRAGAGPGVPAVGYDPASAMTANPVKRARGVVGWREWVALPAVGVPAIKAKVDTGARSSALHAFDLEEFQRDGVRWVRFTVRPHQGDLAATVRVECELLGERSVRSSAGHLEVRPVVRTSVRVGARRFRIELTLTNRDTMGFRMLLGRSAVRRRFVVDPGRSFVQGRPRSPAEARALLSAVPPPPPSARSDA